MIDEEEDSVRNVQRSMDSANLGDFFLSSKRPILFFRFFKDCKTVCSCFFFFFFLSVYAGRKTKIRKFRIN